MEPFLQQGAQNGQNTCSICQKTFTSKVGVRRHTRVVHEGHRPHICSCGKAFATKEQKERHMNSKHRNERPYTCQRGCDQAFASISARIYHHKIVHDQQHFQCTFAWCSKKYSSLMNLRNHYICTHQSEVAYLNWVSTYNQHYQYYYQPYN